MHVTLHSWCMRSLGTSHHNNCISISPPLVRKDGTPSCQARLIGGQKRRVAQFGNLHWYSSCYKFVTGDLGTRMPSISINGPFPATLAGSCFKSSSNRSCSSCRDISQQDPQASLVRELVTGDPMACSIAGHPRKHPLGIVAHRQIWQLLPRLKHGCVESIDQLMWYHTQFNTPMEWRCQFCSGETRFDRYAVDPKWSTCLFLFTSFLTSYTGIPSATHLTTI